MKPKETDEIPNAETLAAIAEAEEMMKHPEDFKSYTDIDEMFAELDREDEEDV